MEKRKLWGWPAFILRIAVPFLYYAAVVSFLRLLVHAADAAGLRIFPPGSSQESAAMTVAMELLLIPVFLLLYREDERSGLRPPDRSRCLPRPVYPASVCGFLGFYFLVTMVVNLSGLPDLDPAFRRTSEVLEGMKPGLLYVLAGLAAPVMEELLFRGLLLNRLREKFRAVLCVILQAAMFGLFHWNLTQGITAFFLGLVLGHCAVKTRSLLPPVLMHGAANLSGLLLFGQGEGGLDPALILFGIPLFSALGMGAYLKVMSNLPTEKGDCK